MIPDSLDPSLHPAQSLPPQLDDGFSPPSATTLQPQDATRARPAEQVDPALWAKSEF